MSKEGGNFSLPEANSKRDFVREQYWKSARQIGMGTRYGGDSMQEGTISELEDEPVGFSESVGREVVASWSERASQIAIRTNNARRYGEEPHEPMQMKDALVTEILLTCGILNGEWRDYLPGLRIGIRKYLPDEGYHRMSKNIVDVSLANQKGREDSLSSRISSLVPHIAIATKSATDSLVVGKELLKRIHPERIQESQDDFILRRMLEVGEVNRELATNVSHQEKEKLLLIKDMIAAQLIIAWEERKTEGGNFRYGLSVTHLEGPENRRDLDLLDISIHLGDNRSFGFKAVPPWILKGVYSQHRLNEILARVDFDATQKREMPAKYYEGTGIYSYASSEGVVH